jgi:hypothetical protein
MHSVARGRSPPPASADVRVDRWTAVPLAHGLGSKHHEGMGSPAGVVEDIADLPLVSGRHRNGALAARRKEAAIRLLSQGQSYQQVADTLGYRNRGSVHQIVKRALEAREVDAVQEHREMARSRLEALLAGIWHQASAGDVGAVRQALGIMTAEIRLLGLEEPPGSHTRATVSTNCGPRTVVVTPTDCRQEGCSTHGSFDR